LPAACTTGVEHRIPSSYLRHENVSQKHKRTWSPSRKTSSSKPQREYLPALVRLFVFLSISLILHGLRSPIRLVEKSGPTWIASRLQPRPCYLPRNATRQFGTVRKNGVIIDPLSRACIHWEE
jgi:hypothetical protein